MALLDHIDPEGLEEFSVVFSDRSLNHMSTAFQEVMNDISKTLRSVYSASAVALIPGGGTYAMEAVARQFARDAKVLVVRNGWFSYRWSQIIETSGWPSEVEVLKARRVSDARHAGFEPTPIEEVVQRIRECQPEVVFAPHVETSAGLFLSVSYVSAMAAAAHEVGALMVLDCIASGCAWVDMAETGVDVLISAPQKGWSASPSAGLVMMSARAERRLEQTSSDSFAIDLKRWRGIMRAYEEGGHGYHATMPTDALRAFRDIMKEAEAYGFEALREAQWALGERVRSALSARGAKSVAAAGFEAPGVVVCYTDDPTIKSGAQFTARGVQIAAGVPLACDEPEGFMTFRIGLFGLDKLYDVEGTAQRFEAALEGIDFNE